MAAPRVNTRHFQAAIDSDRCLAVFTHLVENVTWGEGVRSRHGFTRFAVSLAPDEDPVVTELMLEAMRLAGVADKYELLGIYVNYQKDGSHWTPNHSHKGTAQLVVSLGATRTFQVGTKSYSLRNGDVVLFGSSVHGVPKDPAVEGGRIGIASFMVPKDQVVEALLAQMGLE